MIKKDEFIKRVISLFPFLYVLLVLYGFIVKSTYFYVIGLDITQFLSIGELLFPGITIIELTYIFFGSILISATISTWKHDNEKKVGTDSEITNKEIKQAPKWLEKTIYVIGLILLYSSYFFGFAIILGYHPVINSSFFAGVFFLFGFILLMGILVFGNDIKTKVLRSMVLGLFVYLFLLSIFLQIKKGNSILQGTPEYLIEFSYDNNLIKSSDSLVYYGKTNSYIFMRDLAAENTRVFNLNNISSITFQKANEFGISHIKSNRRDWSEHPIYEIINTHTAISESVTEVSRRQEIFIINRKYLLVKRVKIHIENEIPKWLKKNGDEFLLYDVDPPYTFLKKENDYRAYIVKEGDTLMVTNKP